MEPAGQDQASDGHEQASFGRDYSDAKSTARHLVRLTGGILDEITEHHSVRDVPATAGG